MLTDISGGDQNKTRQDQDKTALPNGKTDSILKPGMLYNILLVM